MKQYLVDRNEIVGPVTMEKPEFSAWEIISPAINTDKIIQQYKDHLTALPRYPIQGVNPWKDGDMVRESEVRFVMCNCGIGHECPYQSDKWLTPCKLAIPVKAKENEKDIQPFERFPDLASTIEWFANNVQCPGTQWNKLLNEINKALTPNQ